jgi:ABC-type Zn uptake system ZnuABC Zn-binding protein ZnuA
MRKTTMALALLFSTCMPAFAAKLSIVVSIAPIYNITRAIAGNRADIILLVPPGASEHTYSPRPSQVMALAKADLFFIIGAGMEFYADKMIKASDNKNLAVLRLTDGIKLMAGADEDEKEFGNPHIWLDPVLAEVMAGKIKDALISKDAADRDYFISNTHVLVDKLKKLDSFITKETKKFRLKELVSFHPAWVYFEERYGLKEVGVIELTPGRQPSPKEIEGIVIQIKKYNIRTIFAEPQLPRKSADVIAAEAGIRVLILDPLGEPDETPDGYIKFIKNNFDIMKEAME